MSGSSPEERERVGSFIKAEVEKRSEVDPQIRVEIDSSHLDLQTLLLNHGSSFGVFDKLGDINSDINKLHGLYHKGTRYLSKLKLRIFGSRPLLLSSTIREDNDMLSVDATNRRVDFNNYDLSEGIIHVRRGKFIQNGAYFESLSVENFSNKPQTVHITLEIAADFCDIFEVRGHNRKSPRPQVYRGPLQDRCLSFHYRGADDVERITKFHFDFEPMVNDRGEICLECTLEPGEFKEFEYDILLLYNEHISFSHKRHSARLESLEDEILNLKKGFAQLQSSNDLFNHWLSRSNADMIALLAPSGAYRYPYAGVPWFNTVFGRDGIITAFQLLMFAPFIARDVLLFLSENQADAIDNSSDAEPGKILHEIRQGELTNLGEVPFKKYYGTIDATPLYVWLAGAYIHRTNDLEVLEKIWPNIKRALAWIDEYGDSDGDLFLEYQRKIPHGLYNQCWKDSDDSISHSEGQIAATPLAVCEVQGYAYQAKIQGAYLADLMGEPALAKDLRSQADLLKQAFNQKFWSEKLQYFALALDGDKNPCEVYSSNPGHCLATGIIDRKKAGKVVRKIFEPDLCTEWGVRTLSANEMRYNPMSYHNGSIWPHDNSIIAYGLARYGYRDDVLRITKSLFYAALNMPLTRLPELYCGFKRRKSEGPTHFPVACSPQAWAVASAYLLIQSFLGLEVDAPGKTIYLKSPSLPDFIDELKIYNMSLGGQESLSFRLIRYETDVGFQILHKPRHWKLVLQKE